MDKKTLTEADIRTEFITPALVGAQRDEWDVMTQIGEEDGFTQGPGLVGGGREGRWGCQMGD